MGKTNAELNREGYEHLQMGRSRQAARVFKELTRREPGNWIPWNNLAIARADLGQEDKALKAVNEALHLWPECPAALDTRSEIYMKLGDAKHARRDAKDCIDSLKKTGEKMFGEPFARIGQILYDRGKLEKAYKNFKKALEYGIPDPRDHDWISDTLGAVKKDLRKYIEKKIAKLQQFLDELK